MNTLLGDIAPLYAKLSNHGPLSEEEMAALGSATKEMRQVPVNTDIVVEGASPKHSTLLLSGYAGRYKLREDGRRQITSLHVSGDFVDLHSLLIDPMDHSIVALTACTLAVVPHHKLLNITERFPRLTRLFWLNTLVDGGTHRQWEFCLGSLQAHQHMGHLICEVYLRLRQIGQTDGLSFRLPLTQHLVSECLAISPVHANRAIQTLRGLDVIVWERDLVTIVNWDKLVELAEFDPTYLRIRLPSEAASRP